jgi:hypothetical protein
MKRLGVDVSLEDDLNSLSDPGDRSNYRQSVMAKHPSGWEPGVAWNGDSGTLTSQPLNAEPNDWSELLAVWDLDPEVFEVVEPVQYRAWDAPNPEGGLRRLFYYRATIRRRVESRASVAELLAVLKEKRPRTASYEASEDGFMYVVPAGDLQIGKPDGDGSEGTIRRFVEKTDLSVIRLKELRRLKRPISGVMLPWLGDCIEGLVSQGGALAAAGRLDLTMSEQLRVYRRLMLYQIQQFAGLTDRIIVPVVPGNHDEVQKAGKVVRRFDDSWAIEGAVAVADALKLSSQYDHISFVFPGVDELTITLDVAGTPVGFAHGHQFGRDPMKWWAGQAHGMQDIGSATLLLGAHLHHLRIEQGGAKTFIQIPAMDGGSTWWRHKTGQDAPAAMVSMLIGHGGWTDLAIM